MNTELDQEDYIARALGEAASAKIALQRNEFAIAARAYRNAAYAVDDAANVPSSNVPAFRTLGDPEDIVRDFEIWARKSDPAKLIEQLMAENQDNLVGMANKAMGTEPPLAEDVRYNSEAT
jgi:hypothetical protein